MRIFTTGFELGEIIENNGSIISNAAGFTMSTSVRRTGSYSIYSSAPANVSAGKYDLFSHYFPNDVTEVYIRIAFMHNGMDSTKSGYSAIFSLRKGTNHQVGLGIEPSSHKIVITRGGSNPLGMSAEVIKRGTFVLTDNVWYVIEAHFVCHAANGLVEVLVNGNTDCVYNGNTAPNGANFDHFQIGATSVNSANTFFYFDDIAVNDTSGNVQNSWIGEGGVYLLKPNSDDTTQWTPSSGNVHYVLVDEVPKNTTDYIHAQNVGAKDIFGFTDLPPEVNIVDYVEIISQAALAQSGFNAYTHVIKLGTTEYTGNTHNVTSVTPNFVLYKDGWALNPQTDENWQVSEINNLKAGVKIV